MFCIHDTVPIAVRSACLIPVLAAAMFLAGCSNSDDSPPAVPTARESGATTEYQTRAARFVNMAEHAGVDFVPRNGSEAQHRVILETLGVGVAVFDFDNDGDLDLFFPGGGTFGPDREILGRAGALYRNEGDWLFTDVSSDAGLADGSLYSHAAAAGDFDNDGWSDLLVTGYGGLRLFHNAGDGTFQAVDETAGMQTDRWATSAAWGDFNGDGACDLYVVHYVNWSFALTTRPCGPAPDLPDVCPPGDYDVLRDLLLLSNGDGTFRDGTDECGLVDGGKGLGVVAADLDLDGDLDLYVANDTVPNFLYFNDGTGRLIEEGLISGTALSESAEADGSMGVDVGDANGDGRPDIWVANYENQSFALYRNDGPGRFQHISSRVGITDVGAVYVGFGTTFLDFDRDGDEDLFATNGHVMYHPKNAPFLQQPLLLENLDGQRFVNVAAQAGPYMEATHLGRGLAKGDLDRDGDLDLIVSHTNQRPALLSNESSGTPHWLALKLIGRKSNRDAIGSVVRLVASDATQLRLIRGGGSFQSTSQLDVCFGLGDHSQIERIEIRWPSGLRQTVHTNKVDRHLVITEPADSTF